MSKKNPEDKDYGLGYVVESKESQARYAVSPENFNDKKHVKVRPLRPGETVRGFRPRRVESRKGDTQSTQTTPSASQAQGSLDSK